MGKNNTKKSENLDPVPYTKAERESKISKVKIQLMQIDMYHVLTDEAKAGLKEFIDSGKDYCKEINLPQYSRILIINFVNDKNKDSENMFHLKFNKIRIEGVGDEHPINKLNKAQEEMFNV